MNRRVALQVGGALTASLLLPRVQAHELVTSTLRVIHPWVRATAADASFAVLCMKFDDVTDADRLVLVESPVAAGASMGGPGESAQVGFVVPPGRETYLGETGTHVRLDGLRFPLEVGRSYPLTLGFEKGGIYITSFSVDFARLQ